MGNLISKLIGMWPTASANSLSNPPAPNDPLTATVSLTREDSLTTSTRELHRTHETPEAACAPQTQAPFASCSGGDLGGNSEGSNQAAPSSNPHTGGFFYNASNVAINGSVMAERVELHQNHGPGVLQQMIEYIIRGAEFDSDERDDPPRCHPNTRTSFLQQLRTYIHDPSLETRFVWLVGPAGVGKSAIMQTLAEVECPLTTVTCSTLFFSRPNKRDDPKKVFTTLAYAFAVADPEYRRYLGEKLAVDPRFLARSIEEQFRRLFITPFAAKHLTADSRRWVVILDGLDECNGEKEQCRIVDLIRESVAPQSQTTPLIWIVASRPEAHLQVPFAQVTGEVTSFRKLEVPMNSEEALRSVEVYLRTEFTKIRRNYSDMIPPLWPSENDFLRLTIASSGLFVFASTLISYTREENPVARLEYILFLISQGSATQRNNPNDTPKKNPFKALDLLYTKIVSDIPPDSLATAKTILAFYLLGDLATGHQTWGNGSANLLTVCNILGIKQHTAYAALRKLHSVLGTPAPKDAHDKVVQFLHASFPDFLTDRSRSQSYYIDLDQELEKIWRCHIKILKHVPPHLNADHIVLSWAPLGRSCVGLRKDIAKRAQYHWLDIVTKCCHRPSCNHTLQQRLSLHISELVDAFNELGPMLFEAGCFDTKSLCDWLADHAPLEFRQELVLREFSVAQLREHDVDRMFTGLCKRRWGHYNCKEGSELGSLDLTDLTAARWNQVKQFTSLSECQSYWMVKGCLVNWIILAELLRVQKALGSHATKVIILGKNSTTSYALIGPLSLYESFQKIEYLVFPHIEE